MIVAIGRLAIILVAAVVVFVLGNAITGQGWARVALSALVAGLVWRASRPPHTDREVRAFRWAAILGGIGFITGYIGPLILSDSNLGPLLGIFITGPGGVLLGALLGAAWPVRKD